MLQENQLAHKKEKLKFIHLKKVFYLISSLENPIDWKLNLHPLISPSRLRRLRPFTSEAKIEKLGNRANLIAHGSGWNFSFLFLSTTPAERVSGKQIHLLLPLTSYAWEMRQSLCFYVFNSLFRFILNAFDLLADSTILCALAKISFSEIFQENRSVISYYRPGFV